MTNRLDVSDGPIFSVHDAYMAVRKELQRRDITLGVIEYDSEPTVEDEDPAEVGEYEQFAYQYSPQGDTELDFAVVMVEPDLVCIEYGPVHIEIIVPGVPLEKLVRQLVDVIQMGLNGQMAVNLTIATNKERWQAAELIWTDAHGTARTIMTVSNHEFFKQDLSALVLKNRESFPKITLHDRDALLPAKVAGDEYVTGRPLDVLHPVPLTKKEYNKLEQQIPVQLIGGEKDEVLWQVFYRRVEFWIISAVIGVPAIALAVWLPDNGEWWHTVLLQAAGLAAMLLIVFLTTIALTKRQEQLDTGKEPWGEKIEKRLNYRVFSALIMAGIAWAVLAVPIWSTKQDINTLFAGYQSAELMRYLPWCVVVMAAAMIVVRPDSRAKKILRAVLFTLGYAGIMWCEYALMYSGEDGPATPMIPTLLVTLLPAAVIIWYLADCFRPVHGKEKLPRDW